MSGRYLDLAIRVALTEAERGEDGRARLNPATDRVIAEVGGRWDRRTKKWSPRKPRQVLTIRFHRGQWPAALFFVDWLKRFARNDWRDHRRVWSALLIGGRRSGKTHLACAVLIVFATLNPNAVIWALSATLETGDELDEDFRQMLPRGWYVRRQAKTGRPTTYRLANGARILLKSAVKAKRLKAGRVDMVLLNEAQELEQLAYVKVRAPIADRGGLVVMTANPPDSPSGRWIEQHYLKAKAGVIDSVVFELDPRDNPLITVEALMSMVGEVDDAKMIERDIFGLFPPIGDTVFPAWNPLENWIDPPANYVDVTAEVLRRELGHGAGDGCGMDFQKTPSMVGMIGRVYIDPEDPTRTEMLWIVDEAVVDDANEGELLDELEQMPRYMVGDGAPETRDPERPTYRGWIESTDSKFAPVHTAVVADASGWTQDGAHAKGETSERWLRKRRWGHLYKPQKDSDKNPAIAERMKAANTLLKVGAGGKRRLCVARHCTKAAEAFRLYTNKNGVPDRRSQWAHIIDGVTYLAYRLFGRPREARVPLRYRGADRLDRARELAAF